MTLRAPLLAVVALAVTAGCASPSSPAASSRTTRDGGRAAGQTAQRTEPSAPGKKAGAPAAKDAGNAPLSSGAPAATSGAPAPGGSVAPGKAGSTPAPGAALPIAAKVSPACVPAGGGATLTVQTVERASLAYAAVYAGKKSGAAPPFGDGFGGNEAGQADFRGQWTARWTVAANAPVGAAYATLVVAARGTQREIKVPFSVGEREADGCGA